jgi:uncharacterized repeat protein (TIGR03803 family)
MKHPSLNSVATLIATLSLGLSLVTGAHASNAQPVPLFTFSCQNDVCPQGTEPQALVQASDGNFYGMTMSGGSNNNGTIYKLTPSGGFTLLFSFNTTSGFLPGSSLVEAPDGSLWGGTTGGGQFSKGTVFKINKDGSGFIVVHNFISTFGAEFLFNVSLVVGKDGNIYGSTPGGGIDGPCGGYGCGTIFQINPKTGTFKNFLFNGTNGAGPSHLIQASDGNFYGFARKVFRLTPAGKFQIVAKLPTTSSTGIIQASNGKLYGMLDSIGSAPMALFELALNGTGLKVFPGIPVLQAVTVASGLTQTADGTFWLTSYGNLLGANGSILQLSSEDGSLLQNIPFNGTDGFQPAAPVIVGTDGNLYGTTLIDNVFSLTLTN